MFGYWDERDHLATPQESVTEWAYNAGEDMSDRAWLLHDWDVWVANPHYVGPKVPHPEDEGFYDEVYGPFLPPAPVVDPYDDEVPF
jgi:hypothetical protein